jgi:Holliday junction resolvasome RuvABC endonuclease subunit
VILSLDLATQTGWCAGSGEELPELGSVKIPDTGEDYGAWALFFEKWLLLLLEEQQPSVVTFESAILPKDRFNPETKRMESTTHPVTVKKLNWLSVHVEHACAKLGLECAQTPNSTVKKALTGNGRAQKPDMMAAAKRCGLTPKNFDEADAFGVWIVSVRAYARQYQHRWDTLLARDRGGMI